MRYSQKGFINIALVIILLVVAGAIGYLAVIKPQCELTSPPDVYTCRSYLGKLIEKMAPKNPATPQPRATIASPGTPTPITSSETANWKTYRNEKYGFEVGYPGDWDKEIKNDHLISFWQKINLTGDLSQENFIQISISQIPLQYKKSFQDDTEKNNNFSIDHFKAIRKVRINTPDGHTENITLFKDDYFFIIDLRSNLSGNTGSIDHKNENLDTTVLEKILATFKFTK